MSKYDLISSEVYISRLDDMYNIRSTDIIPRIPQYVAQAMERIDYPYILEPREEVIEVVDYKAKLPCNIELLEAIKHDGVRLENTAVINEKTMDDMEHQSFMYNGYQVLGDRWISLRFEEGEITVYYRTLPVLQGANGVLFPKVIDNENIHECIDMYIIKTLLMRGYQHPVLSLESRNPLTNPGMIFETKLKQARNAMWETNTDERFAMSKILRDFITYPEAYRVFDFNPSGE